ncbi:DUF488 family protein [Franconibacter sp. IITDAS19]|uniref:DUF488 domain-containing protein n=1 Tax=Franconibacter sp. IITDAS19 TaxID=2930569 RepID=UPI001FFA17B3|nr:DUF488 family protein [Franconibacter sp. IITDAS19]MCK1967673.1 DUF488 family protein [Franconibacter sp. IITDAS19]
MIVTKRVYEAPDPQDGYRVLVDRLWPRGVKKAALKCDEWCKTIAPSAELRKAFHAEAIDFAAFREAYRRELEASPEAARRLAALARKQRLTLLYSARDATQNHAQVLADFLRELA